MSIDLVSQFARSNNPSAPRHLGSRFDRTGTFLPEFGNTVVCHLEANSDTALALAGARKRFEAMPGAHKLALTPLESYHMTLFQGVIGARRDYPYWPPDIAPDASVDAVTDTFMQRLATFPAGPAFNVEVTQMVPTGLVVDGVSAADRNAMAEWRDALAECFGYRHPDHDSYVFHITMAYLVDWIEDDALPAWQAMLEAVRDDIARRAPVLELRAPALCRFVDMNWFEELQVLPSR